MSIFTTIKNLFNNTSSDLTTKVINTTKDYLPIDMPDKSKMDLNLAISEEVKRHEMNLLEQAHIETVEFNNRLKETEGTASDLLQAGFPGRIMLFLRGAQRIIWNMSILVIDLIWLFTDKIQLTMIQVPDPDYPGRLISVADPITAAKLTVLVTLNMLAISFLYGERAFKNLTPMITTIIGMFIVRKTGGNLPQVSEDTKKKPLDLTNIKG